MNDPHRTAHVSNPLDSRHSPRDIDPGRAADPHPREPDIITVLERLEHTTDSLLAAISLFARHMTEQRTPARRRTFTLTATDARRRDDSGLLHQSYGVLNPSTAKIYLGIGGDPATPGNAISVPAGSLLVLPVAVEDVDLAVDPADPGLGAGATFHVLRFNSVQPAFLGAI